MPSFLTRIRNRGPNSPGPNVEESQPHEEQHQGASTNLGGYTPPLDRKIRPDLNALLETYAAEATSTTAQQDPTRQNVQSFSQGGRKLAPLNVNTELPPRKESSDEHALASPLRPRTSKRLSTTLSATFQKQENLSPPPVSALDDQTKQRGRLLLPRAAQGGTFGRHSSDFLRVIPPTDNTFSSLPTRVRVEGKENDNRLNVRQWKTKSRPSTAPNPQQGSRRVKSLSPTPPSRSTRETTRSSSRTTTRDVRQLTFGKSERGAGALTPAMNIFDHVMGNTRGQLDNDDEEHNQTEGRPSSSSVLRSTRQSGAGDEMAEKVPLKSSMRRGGSVIYAQDDQVLSTSANKGKRKAEEGDITPPEQRVIQTKFSLPEERLSKRTSSDPRAPSSYRVKRARISTISTDQEPPSRQASYRASSRQGSPSNMNAGNTGSWASRTSSRPASRQQSHSQARNPRGTPSIRSNPPTYRTAERRRSMSSISHASIPISALVSPHAPSINKSLGMHTNYHMRDPKKLPRIKPTPWSLRWSTNSEEGSPTHAWLFFLGFIIFPVWWFASFWSIPRTRQVGGDLEKAVTLDDPQIEHDAISWRFRCRVMACASLLTYIPFIILVAIFAPR